jgi:PAS domain S-box-containing protein
VHQVELELMNEELTTAKEQNDVFLQKYSNLYNFAPSGYFTLSKDGKILEINFMGSQMLGKERSDLKNNPFGFFVSDKSKPIFNLFIDKIFLNNSQESCEVDLTPKSNNELPVHLTGIVTEDEEQCVIAAIDISELRQIEKALKESEEHDRAIILQTAMDGFWLSDMNGYLLEVNETYCRMSGCNMHEMRSMRISDLESFEKVDDTIAHMAKIILQGEDRFETQHRRKDGSIFDVEISVQYQPIKGGRFVSFIHDITERKMSERYRDMTREILQILNEPGYIRDLINRVLNVLKAGTGFDAVGIRLQDGDDFPYVSQKGFSHDFLLTENSLIERSEDGRICHDKNGNVYLECTCGMVISGRNYKNKQLLTQGGSFWTNDSLKLLDVPAVKDARHNPRNLCIHQGYASIALVPIRTKDKIVGLLQFNDRHTDRFTKVTIEKLEGIASHIGAAIMRKQAEEALNKLN